MFGFRQWQQPECMEGLRSTQAKVRLVALPTVADDVQTVQFAFLANCRDDSQTRHASQRFFEWLQQTGEEALVVRRAVSRARIVKVVAKEMNG